MTIYLIKKDAAFYVQKTVGFKPKDAVAVVPNEFSQEDYPFLYAEQVDDGSGNLVWQVMLDEIAKGDELAVKSVFLEKDQLHKSYIADINAELLSIFGTIDRDKASSLYNTWKEWKDDPAFFADKGLFDEFNNALDTSAKIANYANQKLSQTKGYSVFLMNREKQFRDALSQL